MTITPKPDLVITEVMSNEAKKGSGVTISTSDWWELSNLGTFSVNLQGWRFDDDNDSFADADAITNAATMTGFMRRASHNFGLASGVVIVYK